MKTELWRPMIVQTFFFEEKICSIWKRKSLILYELPWWGIKNDFKTFLNASAFLALNYWTNRP
jgi:hypothetical protein